MSDPIEPRPLRPLIDSYSYHSPLPDWLLLELDKDRSDNEQGWMLGIDEAGRGRRYHHCHRLCDGVLESRIALILILLLGNTVDQLYWALWCTPRLIVRSPSSPRWNPWDLMVSVNSACDQATLDSRRGMASNIDSKALSAETRDALWVSQPCRPGSAGPHAYFS